MSEGIPRARPSKVNLATVVDASLQLVDEQGLDNLTIRAVAAAVNIAPMSLYSHFASKEELLDDMARELSRRLYGVGDHPTWQASLSASCHCMRDLLIAHPNWVALIARPTPVADLPSRERLLQQMTAAAFSPGQALKYIVYAGLLTLSMATLELRYRDPRGISILARRIENLRSEVDQESFAAQSPLTRAALHASSSLDFGAAFSATLNAFIGGIGPVPSA